MSELVQKLSAGEHPVEIALRPEKSIKALKECVDRGYIHVKFTETRGGTELSVRLNRDMTDLTQAEFESGGGNAKFVGDLMLDYVKVRCVANVDIAKLSGSGHLEILPN